MMLVDVLQYYDNWNGRIRINDSKLKPILETRTSEVGFPDGKFYDRRLLLKEIDSFGFYDGTFTVRLKKGEKA